MFTFGSLPSNTPLLCKMPRLMMHLLMTPRVPLPSRTSMRHVMDAMPLGMMEAGCIILGILRTDIKLLRLLWDI